MNTLKIKHKTGGFCRLTALACAGLLLGPTMNVSAAVRTWTGASGVDFNWSTAGNWAENAAPVAGDDLVFAGSTGLTNNNDLTAGTFFRSITFPAGVGSYLLQGNKIVMGNNTGTVGITNNSSSVQTIDLETQHNRQVNYDTTGANMIFSKLAWDQRYSKSGSNDLILLQTLNNTLNGQVTALTGGRLIMAGQLGGCIGQGLQIDSGGTAVSAGPANQIGDSDTRADVTMSGSGVFQVQNTNAAGLPNFEQIPMLRSSSSTAVVENGSSWGPVQLRIGGGTGARVGSYDGIIRDGSGGGVLSLVLNNSSGASFLRLLGANSYTGDTIVTNGFGSGFTRLIVNGVNSGGGNYVLGGGSGSSSAVLAGSGFINASNVNVNLGGVIAPGGVLNGTTLYTRQGGGASGSGGINTGTFAESTATLTITNNVNLTDPSSTLDIHLGGTTVGTYDQLVIAGSGVFSNNSANLNLTVDLGFSPNPGDLFTIVQVPGTDPTNNVGVFASLNGVAANLSQGATINLNGMQFKISYRGEGATFDAGAGNGNDIVLQALADTSAKLTWRGDVSSDWDVQITSNWRDAGNASATFTNLDKTTFNDTGVSTNVNLTAPLTPSKVTVDATKDYFFTGGGYLTGGIVINKTNTGTLTILTANDNSGAAIIDQGTLQIGDNGFAGQLNCSITINSNGVLALNRADDQIFSPASFNGTGKFVHNGSGAMIITNNYSGTFTGITTNSGGVLRIGNGSYGSARLGGLIYLAASSPLEYSFPGSQTIANGMGGPGNVSFANTSGNATIQFGPTATNTSLTGQITVNQTVRLQMASAANIPSGPIVVTDDGSGFYAAYYSSAGGVTNSNAITIQGPGTSGVDTPRGKGALRLANTWSGPITLAQNATIGASAATATILGNISDGGSALTLEYFGGTIQVGPATGVNNYGMTMIDEDYNGAFGSPILTSVRALSSNPFGSGPVQMFGRTQLELNGHDVSIPSLVDATVVGTTIYGTFSQGGGSFSPVVLNNSTNAPATLTVGSDNSSQLFGGLFGNGSTQPLSLAKVGTGTFTITGDSTNSGTVTVSAGTLALAQSTAVYSNGTPVIGSGSFSNASFAIADGATLNVSGRTDGTLTLNAGQTLKHSGASTGNINVTGNVNIGNGALLLGINRSGFAHDNLIASGTKTYSGTLAVTNIGAVLQVGDSFQLFPSAVPGFTAFNLQTDDVVNNVKYTWNNTVSTDGKITVASVGPRVNANPTNLTATVSGTNVTLSWPSDHTGWTIQSQTNAPSQGLNPTNWFDVPGSAAVNQLVVPINTTNGSVFFRMKL